MRRLITMVAAVVAIALFSPVAAQAQQAYTINHGPYLQGLTYDGVIVSFTTSERGFSKVEVREKGSDEVREFRTSKHGLFEANNTHNVIEVKNLKPATDYEYRVVSKKLTRFEPYHVRFGEEVASEWYSFRTFDPAAKSVSFVVANDIHDKADLCAKMLDVQPLDEIEMVFYNGDIMSYYNREGQPFTSFIDVSVEKFAKNKPFAVVRGNHETRGQFARIYDEYIHNTPEGMFYGVFYFGNTAVVMLDGGEDKDDQHPVYGGLVDFDNYRREEAEWLKGVVRSPEFLAAKNRIVIMHVPPIVERMAEIEENKKEIMRQIAWRGASHLGELIIPILNEADIDVMLCGHIHRQLIYPEQPGVLEFPIVVNDNVSSLYVRSDEAGVYVKAVHIDGHTSFEKTY